MANSKVIFGGEVLMDLTADTVTKDKLLKGFTAHGSDGEAITGVCTFDSDTQDATIVVAEMLKDKTAYARGAKLTGTMPDNGAISEKISTKNQVVNVPQGYHDGSGSVEISVSEQSKLIPSNIRSGVEILGVVGELQEDTDGDIKAQSKEVTPTKNTQTILPDSGFNYLTQVTVLGIPYVVSDNSAGGQTVTIG